MQVNVIRLNCLVRSASGMLCVRFSPDISFLALHVRVHVFADLGSKLGVWVWVHELHALELCSVTIHFRSPLSCNFCGKKLFFTQEDL